MLILIKTPTITFSLDVDNNDDVNVIYNKVAERTEQKRFQFNLLYAGDVLLKGSVASNSIKRECTIHMVLIKEMKFTIIHQSKEYPVELPNNIGLKVLHLKKKVKTDLQDRIEGLREYNVKYDLYRIGEYTTPLATNLDLRESVGNFGTLELLIAPKPPPLPTIKTKPKSTYTKTKGGYYESTSSESSGSDDEGYKKPYKYPPTSTTTTTTTTTTTSTPPPPPPEEEEQFDEDALLNSFVESSVSSDVEIVFCFDTTGSMATIIQSVRKQVTQTVNRLMKDIPNIKIGVMALGDYCDKQHVLLTLDLSNDVNAIVSFINSAPNTTGGDEPEAYEYALYQARKLSWSSHTSKAFVMIGDASPHPPSFTDLKINWFKECDDLYEMGVKVYGVRALGTSVFYDDIAERTGGICINFKKFNLITEMFLAICYREASSQKFKDYQKEIEQQHGEDDQEMKEILQDLNKENFQVVTNTEDIPDTSSNTSAANSSVTTTTTTTTTSSTPKRGNIIFKQYGKPTTIKVHEPWYNIQTDSGQPRYYYNENIGYFETAITRGKKAASAEKEASTSSISSSAIGTTVSPSSGLFEFETLDGTPQTPAGEKKNFQAMVVGDGALGKTTFVNGINYIGKSFKSNLQLVERKPISIRDFQQSDLFIICLTQTNKESYSNFNSYLTEIRKRDPLKPIIAAILQKDQNTNTPNIQDLEKFKQIYSLLSVIEYSNKFDDKEIKKICKTLESKGQEFSKSKSCLIM
ncbi:hypothetical protein DLAC_05294 [Tieghemostelium lacteum]|uniref:Ubiquitin-like domain-containing protein n=1 Tax=Tieghemostelium lacteum TaxID=361077 RepID=A0A151ZJ29_TIELA|nr:hypothetical protein DLAC_05294 [Tieghemostelium lacteum]|eukprot:KYQ93890.1 hypothetical protein DLAC_05294 [Tieghemostelium lacteum]